MPDKPSIRVIAEAGVNHNGSLEMAKQLIECATNAGADYVKFQTFQAHNLASKQAATASYQSRNTQYDSQLAMLQALELGAEEHYALVQHCRHCGIEFMSTAFDDWGLELLSELGMRCYKIPSGELDNIPHLRKIAHKALKQSAGEIILSTGMGSMAEIQQAIQTITETGFAKENLTILHATTEYPAPLSEINLKAMLTLQEVFDCKVGYSDHSPGINVSLAASALGASIIEKHFTLDKTLAGPDHQASLEPQELTALVHGIREIETCLGSPVKQPSPSELKNKTIARKSIVAKTNITKGEAFGEHNLTCKRPALGLSPIYWDQLCGLISERDYQADEIISPIELDQQR